MVIGARRYGVKDGCDALGLPLDGFPVLLPRLTITQRPCLLRDFTEHPISRQRIHHVAQYRVVNAVAHEADHVVAEQLAHEAGCPALREVGQAKVAAGDYQTIQGGIVRFFRQQPMQVDKPVPAAVFRNWQHRRCIGLERLARALGCHMKDAVKVSSDQPNGTFAATRQAQ